MASLKLPLRAIMCALTFLQTSCTVHAPAPRSDTSSGAAHSDSSAALRPLKLGKTDISDPATHGTDLNEIARRAVKEGNYKEAAGTIWQCDQFGNHGCTAADALKSDRA